MNNCKSLSLTLDKLYRDLSDLKQQELDVEQAKSHIESEIKAIENKWKNDVSQRGYADFLIPSLKYILPKRVGKIIGSGVDNLYNDILSYDQNSATYNYINKLKNDLNEYNKQLKVIKNEMREVQALLNLAQAEWNRAGC